MSRLHPDLPQRVLDARAGGAVRRAHGLRQIGDYNVAEHSWGVAMLILQLWPEDFERLAAPALVHDIAEAWVGDIPAPVCKYVPAIKQAAEVLERRCEQRLGIPLHTHLTPELTLKLKMADCLEFYLWCREQLYLGNQFAKEPLEEVRRYLYTLALDDRAKELFEALEQRDNVRPQQAGVIMDIVESMER